MYILQDFRQHHQHNIWQIQSKKKIPWVSTSPSNSVCDHTFRKNCPYDNILLFFYSLRVCLSCMINLFSIGETVLFTLLRLFYSYAACFQSPTTLQPLYKQKVTAIGVHSFMTKTNISFYFYWYCSAIPERKWQETTLGWCITSGVHGKRIRVLHTCTVLLIFSRINH